MASEMDDAGKGKRNIIIILVILALFDIASIVVLVFFPNVLPGLSRTIEDAAGQRSVQESRTGQSTEATEDTSSDTAETSTQDAGGDDAVSEDLSEIEPIPASERTFVSEHRVERRDTFYTLTGRVWEDEHLWPDLYVLNSGNFSDPDLIRPGSTISVYEQLGSDGEMSDRELATLLDAYVQAYVTYRSLGEDALERARESGSRWYNQLGRIRVNKAHWLLYSGLRYHRDFLNDFGARIQDRDERVVRDFIDRFGYPGR